MGDDFDLQVQALSKSFQQELAKKDSQSASNAILKKSHSE